MDNLRLIYDTIPEEGRKNQTTMCGSPCTHIVLVCYYAFIIFSSGSSYNLSINTPPCFYFLSKMKLFDHNTVYIRRLY